MRRSLVVAVVVAVVLGGATLAASGQGAAGGSPKYRVVTEAGTVPDGEIGSITAWCDEGEMVTGGGYSVGSINGANNAFVNGPTRDTVTKLWGWSVSVTNDPPDGFPVDFWATAICTKGKGAMA